MEEEKIKKVFEFLNDNDVSLCSTGNYNLPISVAIKAVYEFLSTGHSDLIKKHQKWTWGNWDIESMKNGSYVISHTLSLEDLIELKYLKEFWNDLENTEYLDNLIKNETRKEEIRKTYKYKRKNGFTNQLKKQCKDRDVLCIKCGSNENLCVDHIIELIDGGDNNINNLQLLCRSCHNKKTKLSRLNRKINERI